MYEEQALKELDALIGALRRWRDKWRGQAATPDSSPARYGRQPPRFPGEGVKYTSVGNGEKLWKARKLK